MGCGASGGSDTVQPVNPNNNIQGQQNKNLQPINKSVAQQNLKSSKNSSPRK